MHPSSSSRTNPPSTAVREKPAGTSPITDDRLSALLHGLQEEIFLRLATSTDLVRASAACVSFRRIIADRSFLRRFRKCHSPPLLGFMGWGGFRQVLPPYSSAPIAHAVARAADFSFSFLPSSTRRWTFRDVRDGRVLLDRVPNIDKGLPVFTELAVCDPLHRKYRLLPPIPDDLAASVRHPFEVRSRRFSEVILVPPAPGSSEDEETSFGVVWMAQCPTQVVAFVYSSATGQWQAIASRSWSDLFAGLPTDSLRHPLFGSCQYACGCLYWPMRGVDLRDWGLKREAMLVLDTMTMEFALADYPPGRTWMGQGIGIVEAGEGKLGLLGFSIGGRPEVLHYYNLRGNRGESSSNEWKIENVIPLDVAGYWHSIECSNERYLLLRKQASSRMHIWDSECFSLDVKTFQLERVCKFDVTCGPIYANFPPSLSSRTI